MQTKKKKTRKQHYVWEHYLRAWAIDGQVWCQRKGAIFHTSTENVGQSRDFYRLKEISASDVQAVKLLVSRMGEHTREAALGWVPHFRSVHQLKAAWDASGREDRTVEAELDAAINDFEEDLHARIERNALPVLRALREGDGRVLESDENFVNFAWFIGAQYMRTPRIQRDAIAGAAGTIPGLDIEATWGLLRTIFATNLGASFYVRRRTLRLVFLEAPGEKEFLTGDQPIVNTRAVGLPGTEPPAELELYYPIGPGLALLLDFDQPTASSERTTVGEDKLVEYNRMIVDASDEQVYARSREALPVLGAAPHI
jgi:hypothetical protein